jgi:eukaryotic-like serine/threonine-protein kinase
MAPLLTCRHGHRWQASIEEVTSCPECGLPSESFEASLTAEESYAPVDLLPPRPQSTPHAVPKMEGSVPGQHRLCSGDWPAIPGYEILAERARGGMGVVYRARQTSLNRLVALKMILTGIQAAAGGVARFRAEAEAVARFQHPNIVGVHDVGEHDGRPYMALEFVDGPSLAQELNGAPLSPQPSARLVETLARAVHYAHERGIIHRDLKPANILLQRKSEIPNPKFESKASGLVSDFGFRTSNFDPKICDFGLAKCLDTDSGRTRVGEVMGTPSYMAPEQAGGQVQGIGPAADVYALGAILYELTTGRPPFRAATATETVRQVLTEEPVPPSRLQPALPRDLNTICLKCLEKEPPKRYASALELAEDLHRFVAGEPVRACPVPAWERALKWARRRPAVAAVFAVTATAALGLIGTILVYNRSLQRQRDAADAARQEAQHHLELALDAARRFETNVAGSTLVNVPGQEQLRVELLQQAREFYEKVAQVRGDDPQVRAELGRTVWQLGALKGEVESKAKGIALLQEATRIQGDLASEYPENPTHRKDLARTWNNIGIFLRGQGKQQEALAAWQRALALRDELVHERPDDADFRRDLAQSQHNLGNVYRALGQMDKAESAYQAARQLQTDLARAHPDLSRYPAVTRYHRDLGLTCFNVAGLYYDLAQAEKAEQCYRQALEIQHKLVQAQPKVQLFLKDLSQTYLYLGNLLHDSGRTPEALTAYQQALPVQEALARDYPKFTRYQDDLAEGYLAQAQALYETGTFDRAEEFARKGLALQETLCRQHPETPSYRAELAALHLQLGELAADTGRTAEAEASYRQALDLRKELAGQSGGNAQASDVAETLGRLGDLDRMAGRHDAALARYQQALSYLEKAAADKADVAGRQASVAGCYNRLGTAYHGVQRTEQARSSWQQALATLGPPAPRGLALVERRRQHELATAHDGLGALALAAGDLSNANAHFQKALDIRQQLAREHPSGFDTSIELAGSFAHMAAVAKGTGGLRDALAWHDRALGVLETVLQREKRLVAAREALRAVSAERADLLGKIKPEQR